MTLYRACGHERRGAGGEEDAFCATCREEINRLATRITRMTKPSAEVERVLAAATAPGSPALVTKKALAAVEVATAILERRVAQQEEQAKREIGVKRLPAKDLLSRGAVPIDESAIARQFAGGSFPSEHVKPGEELNVAAAECAHCTAATAIGVFMTPGTQQRIISIARERKVDMLDIRCDFGPYCPGCRGTSKPHLYRVAMIDGQTVVLWSVIEQAELWQFGAYDDLLKRQGDTASAARATAATPHKAPEGRAFPAAPGAFTASTGIPAREVLDGVIAIQPGGTIQLQNGMTFTNDGTEPMHIDPNGVNFPDLAKRLIPLEAPKQGPQAASPSSPPAAPTRRRGR